jgi:hypothetical protein
MEKLPELNINKLIAGNLGKQDFQILLIFYLSENFCLINIVSAGQSAGHFD